MPGVDVAGIARRRQHDAHAAASLENLARAGSARVGARRQQQRRERLVEQRQHDLRLGIAEAAR